MMSSQQPPSIDRKLVLNLPGVSRRQLPVAEIWNWHSLQNFKPSKEVEERTPTFEPTNVHHYFSSLIDEIFSKSEGGAIKFYRCNGEQSHSDQNQSTRQCPQYLAMQPDMAKELPDGSLAFTHWSAVELVLEDRTAPSAANTIQIGVYLKSLLTARPDLLLAQGILVEADCLTLLFGVAGGILDYVRIPFGHADFGSLVYAFLGRLSAQDADRIDPTLKRRYDKDSQGCTFDVTLADADGLPLAVCTGYNLKVSHSPFAGRTSIFYNNWDPTVLNDTPIRVIKDQYTRSGYQITEVRIMDRIQAGGKIPGICYAAHWETSSGRFGDRRRTRIAMDQFGTPFLKVPTMKEGLCLIYDLLEVTRFLHKTFGVLHRDISPGNVLFDDSYGEPTSSAAKERLGSLRYIGSILDPTQSQWKTKLLLIDFDVADVDSDGPQDGRPFQGTGTPQFMARSVARGIHISDPIVSYRLPKMPEVPENYALVHQERLARFSPNLPTPWIPERWLDLERIPLTKHELRHDAESVVWLLLHWAFLIQPTGQSKSECISIYTWAALSKADASHETFLFRPIHGLHSKFAALEPFLSQLVRYVAHDHYWIDHSDSTYENIKDPDYTHETLQRMILNFVIENESADFMNLPISDTFRVPSYMELAPDSSTRSKRSFDEVERSQDSSAGPPSKKLCGPSRGENPANKG